MALWTWRPATLALDQVNEGAALAVSFVKQGTAAGDAGCRAWRRPPATSGWTRGTDPVRRRSRRAEARLELPMFVPALDGRTQARNLALRSLLPARHEEGKQSRQHGATMGRQPATAPVAGVVEDGGEEARLASRGCRVEPTRARRQGIGDSRDAGATRLAAEELERGAVTKQQKRGRQAMSTERRGACGFACTRRRKRKGTMDRETRQRGGGTMDEQGGSRGLGHDTQQGCSGAALGHGRRSGEGSGRGDAARKAAATGGEGRGVRAQHGAGGRMRGKVSGRGGIEEEGIEFLSHTRLPCPGF